MLLLPASKEVASKTLTGDWNVNGFSFVPAEDAFTRHPPMSVWSRTAPLSQLPDKLWQLLDQGRAGHHSVAARLPGRAQKLRLGVRAEGEHRHPPLLGQRDHPLPVDAVSVQVEDDEGGRGRQSSVAGVLAVGYGRVETQGTRLFLPPRQLSARVV